jgi:hypothetical protein
MKRGKGNPIPQAMRLLVFEREQGRCFACGMRGYEMSHRRPRGIRDGFEHAAFNILLFCRTCHIWLHGHTTEAHEKGWAISRYEDDPASIPALRWDGALVYLTPEGGYRSA